LAVAICLALGGLFGTGCKRPPAPDATVASPTTPANDAAAVVSVLSADPNPVPGRGVDGKTTITWATGSPAVGDVYAGPLGNETLFATGPKGYQVAPWIKPGSTEFRLYNHADHKLLAQLTVTMPSSDASADSPMATPVSSASP
jgi:hypothetical protein